jgi:TolB-like protein
LSRQRQFLSAAALLLLLAAGMAVFNAGDWLGGIEDKSIVVLPFENLSPDPDDKYLADGFHEEIISRLNVQKTLIVIAPQSANQAARAGWGSQEIASKLQVKYVLKGSVQKIGEDLRIITRLEEAKSAEVISSKTLDRKLHDFFDVQDEVAHRVVTDLGLRITGTIPEPRSLKAWEYARKAAEFNFLLPPDQARWKELMQKALNEDSTWLEAWYRWEWTHFLWFGNSGDSSDYLEGMKARDKILAKDRDSFVGRYSVIAYDYWIVNDYPKVIRQLEELLEDYPNSAQIWGTKGLAHRRNGEYQQFVDSYRQLLRLNPLARGAMRELAETLVGLAHFDQAMHFRREIRDTGIDRYYGIPFNAALLNGRLENLRTIVAEAGNDPKCPPFLKADVESRAKANGFLYRRQYDSLLSSRWTSMDSYDSALIYYLKGDMPGSIASCSRCISKYGRLASSAGNIQVRKVHELNRTVCYAGAGNKDWKERLAAIRDGLIPFNLTFYFRNAALSGLIAGDYEFTMEALKQWQAQQCGYKPLGPAQPFELLVKNHPLLDPLRSEHGFDELWDGNHLKIKPLKLPKEWR